MGLLEVQDLHVAFGPLRQPLRAVDGVSFSVDAGETLALVGESGCGKSTVSRLVLRLIEPDSGSVHFEGRDLLALEADELRAFRRDAQIIYQDPYASLNPRMTVSQILTEPLALHKLVPPPRRRETEFRAARPTRWPRAPPKESKAPTRTATRRRAMSSRDKTRCAPRRSK